MTLHLPPAEDFFVALLAFVSSVVALLGAGRTGSTTVRGRVLFRPFGHTAALVNHMKEAVRWKESRAILCEEPCLIPLLRLMETLQPY